MNESSFSNNHQKFKTWIHKDDVKERNFAGRLPLSNLLLATLPFKLMHYQIFNKTTKSQDFLEFPKEIDIALNKRR